MFENFLRVTTRVSTRNFAISRVSHHAISWVPFGLPIIAIFKLVHFIIFFISNAFLGPDTTYERQKCLTFHLIPIMNIIIFFGSLMQLH